MGIKNAHPMYAMECMLILVTICAIMGTLSAQTTKNSTTEQVPSGELQFEKPDTLTLVPILAKYCTEPASESVQHYCKRLDNIMFAGANILKHGDDDPIFQLLVRDTKIFSPNVEDTQTEIALCVWNLMEKYETLDTIIQTCHDFEAGVALAVIQTVYSSIDQDDVGDLFKKLKFKHPDVIALVPILTRYCQPPANEDHQLCCQRLNDIMFVIANVFEYHNDFYFIHLNLNMVISPSKNEEDWKVASNIRELMADTETEETILQTINDVEDVEDIITNVAYRRQKDCLGTAKITHNN